MNITNNFNQSPIEDQKSFDLDAFIDSASQSPRVKDLPEPTTAEAVLNADLKNAQDIKVPETPEFLNPAYSTTGQGENDIANDEAVVEPSFTIDEPLKPKEPNKFLNVDWNQQIKMTPEEPVDNSQAESNVGQEKQIGKIEQMQLRVNLRNAVDQFNKITAQAARLVADIENKGGNEGEIPRINITQVLEDPRLHDPRVSSSVKSRFLQELTEKLKNETSKTETGEYENVIQQIGPAKAEVSKALEALLAHTNKSEDVKRIRTTLADIIFETNETISFKQDLEAICINKESEIDEQSREPEKESDPLPNVSTEIIDTINKIGEKKVNEGLSVDSNQLSVGEEKENEGLSVISDQLSVEDKNTATEKIEPASPEKPKFEEFVKFGPEGNKVSEDTEIHDEVSLSPTAGNVDLSSDILAHLKRGDGVPNETKIVNLTQRDLDNTINPTHAIKARLEDLKNTPQNLQPGSSDMFGSDNSDNTPPIRDVDNRSIASSSQPEPLDSHDENKIPVPTESPAKNVFPIEKGPDLEVPKKPEAIIEIKPNETTMPAAPAERGPDLVEEREDVTEPLKNEQVINSETEPVVKKSGLFERMRNFLHTDNPTASEAGMLEREVGSTRAKATEVLAEQKEM